ncbi:hypothetical protein GCM10023187_20640 [Nibrella viscosa]|uniref:Antitoxin Xre-like helix-turn-helix domain-containing protein n=2 Tax=Nibrella viscosa TaxID=1084524 RepID=A0ABP8KC61_9BACT
MRRRVDEVARVVGLTDKEMARILNMSIRSLHSKAAHEPLALAAGERLLLLEQLIQHGLSVFNGRADLLARWLHTPLMELAYRQGGDRIPEPVPVRSLGQFGEPDAASENLLRSPVTDANTDSTLVPQSPIAVLDTVSGFSLAEDVLGRIEWGIVG